MDELLFELFGEFLLLNKEEMVLCVFICIMLVMIEFVSVLKLSLLVIIKLVSVFFMFWKVLSIMLCVCENVFFV